jgi:hypothetical protein
MATEIMIAMKPKKLFRRASIEDEGMIVPTLIPTNLAAVVPSDSPKET